MLNEMYCVFIVSDRVVGWPSVFSVPRDTTLAPLGEKGQFIDFIKAPLGGQDEICNLLISPTQIQAAENLLSSLR